MQISTGSHRDLMKAQRRAVWFKSSMLLLAFILVTSGIDRTLAADRAARLAVPPTVDRTVPAVSPPAALHFSSPPADAEFLRTGLFAEPLVPVSPTTPQENRALAEAVLAYRDAVRKAGAADAVRPLLAFLAAHPDSAWRPALQLNLGLIYRKTGHFSKALAIWQQGWSESRGLTDRRGHILADAIVAHLSQMEAYLGRKELLHPLLVSIQGRRMGGTAAQLMTDSHTGFFEMVHHPEVSFLCGPLALKRILYYHSRQPSEVALRVLDAAHSTPLGLSLSMVQRIADQADMHYQMAFRAPGAKVILPAVANWKVGHYAAIVDRVNGRYVIEDTTFGEDIRMSAVTLDEEASGYFLVPNGPLPDGWRPVSTAEGDQVWGRGNTGNNHDPGATGPSAGSNCDSSGCTTATVELEVVGLQLHDTPVGYKPPLGPPVRFELYYSHRDTQQPTTFSYTNFGPKWTFTWLSYVIDNVNSSASASLYRRGGGSEPYTFSSTSATTSYPGPYSQAILTRTVSGGASTGFTLTFPDGSFEQFNQAVGHQFFMTVVADPSGNKVTLTYDSQMRIVAITDAVGQVSTLSYGFPNSPLVVSEITDPFGRSASFTYNSSGQLASITDTLGITSSYTYGQGTDPDFINTLTTPYGATTFTYGDSSTNSNLGDTRFLKTVDPLGRTSYVEYDQGIDAGDTSGGVMKNASLIPSGMNTCDQYLYYRNTFIFDANEYALASQGSSLNYSLGKVIHWLHTSDETTASRVPESIKEPLENRVWYNYPGQPTGASCDSIFFGVSSGGTVTNGASDKPIAIGRVLDSGSTQLQMYQYNANGEVTVETDPLGRQYTYTYAANGIDRLSTSNTTNGTQQLLESRTYNSQHSPLTVTGPNGKTAHYQYNTAGQLTKYTDQLGRFTTLSYDSTGHLRTIQGPLTGEEYTLAYDNVGRVAAATDPAGATVRFTYDAADRPTVTTYPDGTTSQLAYHLLDLASSTDRLGQTTSYSYDADRELIETTDPLNHTVQRGYNLAGRLDSLTDQNSHTTSWTLDAQSRITAKQYADGTSLSVAYESGKSLIAEMTDALSQSTVYVYNTDDTLAGIGYMANQPTPSVSFSYDPAYRRVTSMTDGTGTTTYNYYPVSQSPVLGANQLESVTSPIAGTSGSDTVTYSYDALNRVIGESVNGASQSLVLDALGRVTSASNPLDTFTYSYTDATPRVTGVSSNHGPTFAMTYFGPQGDELLEQLTAAQSGTSLSQLGYTYNADDNVTSFTSSVPSSETTTYGYDAANRLTSALLGSGTPQYQYGYDPASNLTSITDNGPPQSFSYSSTNTISSGTYDANGSPTELDGNTYTWDGANRIVGFAGPGNAASTFTYDGLGRLVRIVDSVNGNVTADHSYFWCGSVRCLAHDNTQNGSPVSTQYFGQGVIAGGTPYYYVQDRLGSVRQLIASGGTVAAQFDYDPYGNPTTLSGTVGSDIGYAGYFYHAASGLEFTLYRAYDPVNARWLNRDPIGEAGGINLYAYVDDNPSTFGDPYGLCMNTTIRAIAVDVGIDIVAGAIVGAGIILCPECVVFEAGAIIVETGGNLGEAAHLINEGRGAIKENEQSVNHATE